MQKYTFNQYYFDDIDNPDKAYWLGFLWGDVSIYPERGDFKLELSIKDRNHLEKFKRSLESTHPIKDYPSYAHGFWSKEQKESNENVSSRFYISNKHIVKTLAEKHGIIKNRTDFSKVVNNVPKEYYVDLIRGLIDSDGGISCNSHKVPVEYQINLIASESVLTFVNNWFQEQGITKTFYCQHKRHPERDEQMKNLRITGNLKVLRIGLKLYDNANVFLDRKKDKILRLLQQSKEYIIQNPKKDTVKKISSYEKAKKHIIEILKEYNKI